MFKLYAEYSSGMAYKNIEQLIELSGAEGTKKLICSIAKDYHTERMKSILPSEQEINKKLQAINKLMFDYQYKTSFNTVFDNISEEIDELIELLTKGDR